MKKTFALLLAVVLVFSPFGAQDARAVEPSHIRSRTAVLMDADTGQILYNKGMHQQVYPASVTKILTALLVVENASPNEIMIVSASALAPLPSYGAHIALVEGEEISVEDALFALMLPSANDAANVLAEHIAGSQEAFAQMMTERAHAIGAVNSNFTNAHGLHCDDHFSTAFDMALITAHAMLNEDFQRYFGAARHTMEPSNMNTERNWTNFQYMLVPEVGYFSPDVIGGKVGFTHPARHTMSTVARRDDRTLVAVVMYSNMRTDKFVDTRALLDFGFDEFVPFTIGQGSVEGHELPVMQEGDAMGSAVFNLQEDFTALVHISADTSQLQIRHERAEYHDYSSPAPYVINFEMPTDLPFVPALLGAVEIEPVVYIPVVVASANASARFEVSSWLQEARMPLTVIGCVFALLVLLVVRRRYKIKKRRRLQMERLERRRRQMERNSRYNYPPPYMVRGSNYYSRNSVYDHRKAR